MDACRTGGGGRWYGVWQKVWEQCAVAQVGRWQCVHAGIWHGGSAWWQVWNGGRVVVEAPPGIEGHTQNGPCPTAQTKTGGGRKGACVKEEWQKKKNGSV